MVESPQAVAPITITDDGETFDLDMVFGEATVTNTAVEIPFEWRGGDVDVIGYTVVAVDPTTGTELASKQPTGGAVTPTPQSGTLSISNPSDTLELYVAASGSESERVSYTPPQPFSKELVSVSITELTDGPYAARPWEGGDQLQYRVSVENQNAPSTAPIEFEALTEIYYSRFGNPTYDRVDATVQPGERVDIDVTYGPDTKIDPVDTLQDNNVCAILQDFSVGGQSLGWEYERCLNVSFVERLTSSDVGVSGNISELQLTPGLYGYTGPGGQFETEASVSVGRNAPNASMAVVLTMTNLDVDDSVSDSTTRSLSDVSWYVSDGFSNLPWPSSWELPFTLEYSVEVFINDLSYIDSTTPFATSTQTYTVPPGDGDGSGDDRGGTDPVDDDPTKASLDVTCTTDTDRIVVGETATVTATVTAGGGDEGSTGTVQFTFGNQSVTREVLVEPNGSVTVEADFTLAETGSYTPTVELV